MPSLTKIATCSYCAARTVLRFQRTGRHELSCASCGAPLHEMKAMKLQPEQVKRAPAMRPVSAYEPTRKRRKPKRRSWNFWEEVEDFVEDIFD